MSEDPDPNEVPRNLRRLFTDRKPGQLVGKGHPAGDLLEAWKWQLLEQEPGRLRLRCDLPDALRNPRGVLFGGFTATYVDLIAIFTCRTSEEPEGARRWLNTVNMRLDYIEPIEGAFQVESTVINRRGRTYWVETRFMDDEGTLLAFALTTLREMAA